MGGPDTLPTTQPGDQGAGATWGSQDPTADVRSVERLELALRFTTVLSPSFSTSIKCVKGR